MKTNSFRSVLTSYIKMHYRMMVAFFLFILIFIVVFWLYWVPIDTVLYASALSLAVAILFVLYDFWKYYRKHSLLVNLLSKITVSLDELPDAGHILERDYQNLVSELHDHHVMAISQADNKHSDMVDYYTLWVHQIKTPIAAMRLLLQTNEVSQNAELLQEMFKIERYVEMVLQYLRLDSMSSDLMLQHYPLLNIIKKAAKKYATVFIHKKIRLDLQEMECSVLTDEKWLLFVIEQILSNGLKYTNYGTISIYMDPSSEKTLVIQDTGMGIQEEDLPRIFEKGFTGYNGRMNRKSTGIGLYMSKQILNKLSHQITILSQVGAGTKVKIDLSSADIPMD